MSTVLITGNTYPHKDALRRMGGRWDPDAQGWRVPADRGAEAQQLVGASPVSRERPRRRGHDDRPHSQPRRQHNPEPALAAGEQVVRRPSRDRDDAFVAGTTLHMPAVRGASAGGGPDGRYWTVTWAGKYRVGESDDTWADRYGSDWACVAHVRPATDAEAAPIAARIEVAQRREAAAAELQAAILAMPSQGRSAHLPEWAVETAVAWREPRPSGSLATHDGRLYVTDAGAAYYHSVYDDDPVIRVALTGTPEYDRVVAAVAAGGAVCADGR